jgi:diaphanous 1
MSVEPSQSTIKAVQDMEASEEEEENAGGTAKQIPARPASKVSVSSSAKTSSSSMEWRQSLSQARLSSVFDSWLHSSTSTSPPRVTKVSTPERMSVSEPMLMGRTNGDADSQTSEDDSGDDSLDADEFEQLLVCASVYLSYMVTDVRVG